MQRDKFSAILSARLADIVDTLVAAPLLDRSADPAFFTAVARAVRATASSEPLPDQVSLAVPGSAVFDAYVNAYNNAVDGLTTAIVHDSQRWGSTYSLSSPPLDIKVTDAFWSMIPSGGYDRAALLSALEPRLPSLGFVIFDGELAVRYQRGFTPTADNYPNRLAAWVLDAFRYRIRNTVLNYIAGREIRGVSPGDPAHYVGLLDDLPTLINHLKDIQRLVDRYVEAYVAEWDSLFPSGAALPPSPPSSVATLRNTIESLRQSKDDTGSLAAFQAFPVVGRRARQAKASRTWGVELEVTDAGRVYEPDASMKGPGRLLVDKSLDIPTGWAAVRDGSLRNLVGDGKWYDPWEFVSPVFSTTFDAGLRHLCSQIEGTVKYQRAGVHIHVNATNRQGETLNRMQVDRLLFLYNAVSPLFDPFLMRRTREFCKPFDLEEWLTGWRRRSYPDKQARFSPADPRYFRRGVATGSDDSVENVRLRMQEYKTADDDNTHRYRDVNVESLAKHGTIEFRALGAVYDYDTIVKWAWMCREMVNYAASSRPLPFLTNVTTLDEFLSRLRSVAVETLSISRGELAAQAS